MRFKLLLAAVIAAVVIVGCGSDPGDASKPVEAGTAKAPNAPVGGGPALGGTTQVK